MKRRVAGAIAVLVLVSLPRTLMAQAKTVTSQLRTETATVESTEASTRTVTLKKPDGTYVTTVAGPDITRFDEIKVGDKVTARYYENLVIRLKKPGESEVDTKVADDLLHRSERLEVHGPGAGQACPLEREGRRQGRHRLDGSRTGGARALSPIERHTAVVV